MTEENPFAKYHSVPRRRRRSVLGKDWQPPTIQDVDKGVWCKFCNTRHPYMGTVRLESKFEKEGTTFVLWWICPRTHNYIKKVYLGDTRREVDNDDKSIPERREGPSE